MTLTIFLGALSLGSATPRVDHGNATGLRTNTGNLTVDYNSCTEDPRLQTLLRHIVGADGQMRSDLECNQTLMEFAAARAQDMADRDYFSHITPDREGPNELLRQSGYPLPSMYGGVMANSVEAIAAGYADPAMVWQELKTSNAHRRHLRGELDFYAEQNEVGIGYARGENTRYEHYWVIVFARKEREDEPRYLCTPGATTCFVMSQ